MDEKYKPIDINDIFPKLDSQTIDKVLSGYKYQKKPKIETIDYLLDSLSVAKESVKYEDIFIRNYIYVSLIARKHLLEIEERIKEIKKQENKINDKESYASRKLKYFLKKNEKAKNEVVDFLCYGLSEYICEHNDSYSDLIDREQDKRLWALYGPTYDYNYNYKYYDPNYDFSTYAKFCDTPNMNVIDSLKNVDSIIALKEKNLEEYYKKVIDTVDSNQLLENMAERIEMNYHFHKRKEVFETMTNLFKEEKYTTFILTAVIQIEGMFYELVSIRYGRKENQGTLIEKVEKTFSKNSQQKHALYPYFAFDIPELRNKVAHIGLIDDDNIRNMAYELVLDLNCILALAEKESLDKFKYMIQIFNKAFEKNLDDFENEDDFHRAITMCVFEELYMYNLMTDEYFWELLSKPQEYEEELIYYLPQDHNDEDLYLKDIVQILSNIVYSDMFWQIVLDEVDTIKEIKPNAIHDIGSFIEKLKNMFIPRLKGTAKELCCQVNKKLQEIKRKEKI